MNIKHFEKDSPLKSSAKVEDIIQDWNLLKSGYTNEKLCWCLEKCQSKFYNRGENWYFSNQQDATLFALKYGVDWQVQCAS